MGKTNNTTVKKKIIPPYKKTLKKLSVRAPKAQSREKKQRQSKASKSSGILKRQIASKDWKQLELF